MRQPPSRRTLFLGGRRYTWTGATWAVDGSGRAYNTPSFGGSLLTNGGMETFSSGQATGWTKGGAPTLTAEGTIVQSGALSQKMVTAGTSDFIYQYPNTIAGRFYEWSAYIYGAIRYVLNTNFGSTTILLGTHSTTQWDQLFLTAQAVGSASGFLVGGPAGGGTGYADSLVLREIAQSSLMATVATASADPTIATQINALTATAGLVSKVDNPNNPLNFVSARFDGQGNLRLDKTVNGVLTNLQTNVVSFSANTNLEIRWPSSTTVSVWANGIQVGSTRTVADAGIVANENHGLLSTNVGNLFNDFLINGQRVPFVFF